MSKLKLGRNIAGKKNGLTSKTKKTASLSSEPEAAAETKTRFSLLKQTS